MKPPARPLTRRLQSLSRARWLFGFSAVVFGLIVWQLNGQWLALGAGLAAWLSNGLWRRLLARQPVLAPPPLAYPQLVADSLLCIVAVAGLHPLGAAVEFGYLFPLFVATLLSPREGLFITAGLCGLGHLVAALLQPPPAPAGIDPLAGALLDSTMLCGALFVTATILNFLVRTLAGIESDLALSENQYRELASRLEDEVNQQTGDLRQANDMLNQRNRELTRLREIDAAIHSSTDLGMVLQHVVDGVAELLPQAEAAIFLCEPPGTDLRLHRFSATAERRAAALEALCGWRSSQFALSGAAGTPAAVALGDGTPCHHESFAALLAAQLPDLPRAVRQGIERILGYSSLLAVPLVLGQQRLGLLAIGLRGPLLEHDIVRAGALATQAAMALVRGRNERNLLEQQAALEQAFRELQRSQEQVIHLEKMRAVGEMTSGVAHNFNNALTAILGTTQVILSEVPPPGMEARLRLIERTAQDAARLVQRIRAFTRDEAPTTDLADLNDLVRDAIAMTEPRWKDHPDRTEFPITVSQDLASRQTVQVDATAVREVLLNLLINAIKALPTGGAIACRTWDDGPLVRVTISDNGVGMDEAVRKRCFEPFFTTDQETGTGLGLSMAYGIVQRHRGEIQVASCPGTGTEFQIALPAAAGTARVRPAAPGDAVSRTASAGQRVLVVDDQPMVRQTIAEMLDALGHKVTLAASGDEALAQYVPDHHDLVLTDWGMPGMSGLALARRLKQRSPHLPIILMTGHDATLPRDVADAAEITLRLQKPVALHELQRALADPRVVVL